MNNNCMAETLTVLRLSLDPHRLFTTDEMGRFSAAAGGVDSEGEAADSAGVFTSFLYPRCLLRNLFYGGFFWSSLHCRLFCNRFF